MGVGIPGFPNMLMGRTNYLSYGLTYGTMDQHDYFVEEVIDGHVKRPNKCKYRSGSSLVLFIFVPFAFRLQHICNLGNVCNYKYVFISFLFRHAKSLFFCEINFYPIDLGYLSSRETADKMKQ